MTLTWLLRIDNGPLVLAIGNRDDIMDAAYDNGALRVTIYERKVG